jgi:hypothetical protein
MKYFPLRLMSRYKITFGTSTSQISNNVKKYSIF